jgi:hypothetical protein
MALKQQPYNDREFEVRKPSSYPIVFGWSE